jgi:hypothetical protein
VGRVTRLDLKRRVLDPEAVVELAAHPLEQAVIGSSAWP